MPKRPLKGKEPPMYPSFIKIVVELSEIRQAATHPWERPVILSQATFISEEEAEVVGTERRGGSCCRHCLNAGEALVIMGQIKVSPRRETSPCPALRFAPRAISGRRAAWKPMLPS